MKKWLMSNETYDNLRAWGSIILPILATLLTGISEIWNIPFLVKVVGTVTLVASAINLLLKKSSEVYWDEVNKETTDADDNT